MGRQMSVYLDEEQIEKIQDLVEKDRRYSSFSHAVRQAIDLLLGRTKEQIR